MKWISKISKSCFESKGYSYKKSLDGYVIYYTANIFWIKSTDKIGVCKDFEELREVSNRLNLRIKNKKR